MSFKIAIIGAGSVGFTKKLFTDLLCVPEFRDVEIALTDISQHNPVNGVCPRLRPSQS